MFRQSMRRMFQPALSGSGIAESVSHTNAAGAGACDAAGVGVGFLVGLGVRSGVGSTVAADVGSSMGKGVASSVWTGSSVGRGVRRGVRTGASVGPVVASRLGSSVAIGVLLARAVMGVGLTALLPPSAPLRNSAAPATAAMRMTETPAMASRLPPLPDDAAAVVAEGAVAGRGDPAMVPTAGSRRCPHRWQNVLPGGLTSPHVRQGWPPIAGGGMT